MQPGKTYEFYYSGPRRASGLKYQCTLKTPEGNAIVKSLSPIENGEYLVHKDAFHHYEEERTVKYHNVYVESDGFISVSGGVENRGNLATRRQNTLVKGVLIATRSSGETTLVFEPAK